MSVKRICFCLVLLFVLVGCDGKLPWTDSNPDFQSHWESVTFEMDDTFYYFRVYFDSKYNLVKVFRYKKNQGSGVLKERFETTYKKVDDKTITFSNKDNLYKIENVNPQKKFIYYKDFKIQLYKM